MLCHMSANCFISSGHRSRVACNLRTVGRNNTALFSFSSICVRRGSTCQLIRDYGQRRMRLIPVVRVVRSTITRSIRIAHDCYVPIGRFSGGREK